MATSEQNELRSEIWDKVVERAKDPQHYDFKQAVEKLGPFHLLAIIDSAAEVFTTR